METTAKNLKDTYGGQWSDDPALLKKLLDAGETILFLAAGDSDTLRCRQVEDVYRFGQYDLAKDKLCAKFLTKWGIQFLIPAPSVEPAPLEWHEYAANPGEFYATDGWFRFEASSKGGAFHVRYKGLTMDGDDLANQPLVDDGRENVHQWRVNHINSMIKK